MRQDRVDDEDDAYEYAQRLEKVLASDRPSMKLVRKYANLISKWASKELKAEAEASAIKGFPYALEALCDEDD